MKIAFLTFQSRRKLDIIKKWALEINNELMVPMKITNIIEEKAKGEFTYFLEVQDVLDEREWNRSVALWILGWEASRKI